MVSLRERFGDMRLLWQTRLGAYCLGVDELVPIALVPTLDDGVDFDLIEQETGIHILSLERLRERRGIIDDAGIDQLMPAVQQEALAAMDGGSWAAVCPYPGRTLTDFARQQGLRCGCLDWETFWWFSSKANLLDGLAELGLPVMHGRWTRLGGTRYSELVAEFGGTLVLQVAIGVAGSGTAIVKSEADYAGAAERFGDSEVRIAPYAGGLSFNINAVTTGEGTAVAYPSVQIVGQEVLNAGRATHCGNDFSATARVEASLVASVREQTARIGDWMAGRGYRGLFGLDFVVYDVTGEACAVDLNPRWQGSTSLEAQAAGRQGRTPLAAMEIGYQLGLVEDCELMAMADTFFEPLEGAQVLPKNRAPGYWQASARVEAGVYSPEMTFERPALRLSELRSPEEVLLNSGIPRPGRPLAGGITLARLASLGPAVDPSTGRLMPWAEKAARGLYEALALEPEVS